MHLLVVQSRVDQVFVRQTLLPLQHCSQLEHSQDSDVAVTQAAAGDLSVFMWTAERACAMLPWFFCLFFLPIFCTISFMVVATHQHFVLVSNMRQPLCQATVMKKHSINIKKAIQQQQQQSLLNNNECTLNKQ